MRWLRSLMKRRQPRLLDVKGYLLDPEICVAREVARLGVLREEAVPWLTEMIIRYFNQGDIDRHIRSHGTLLSRDELKALGLRAETKFTHELLSYMTEEAKKDPLQSIRELAYAILFCLYRTADELFLEELLQEDFTVIKEVEFMAGTWDICEQARKHEGKVYKLGKQPKIPLKGCCARVCNCSYLLR